ncbi:hypothetical protein TNCV_4871671 [Trichonephila clavipes]|nr:hypothetical protein TNCV_4871671 [Trichonephila clavipes]
MDWTVTSPDLIQIKHACDVLGTAIATRKPPPKTIQATRELLAPDHVILNHSQVTWTTPELAPSSPSYHTSPTGGRFSSRQI